MFFLVFDYGRFRSQVLLTETNHVIAIELHLWNVMFSIRLEQLVNAQGQGCLLLPYKR